MPPMPGLPAGIGGSGSLISQRTHSVTEGDPVYRGYDGLIFRIYQAEVV